MFFAIVRYVFVAFAVFFAQAAPFLLSPALAAVGPIEVTKDATTAFTREYSWSITKTANPTELTFLVGETRQVDYTVSVQQSVIDSDWSVSGTIAIYNGYDELVTITSVTDDASGTLAAVSCASQTIAALGSVSCTYSAQLPNGSDGVNTVTVDVVTASGLTDGGIDAVSYNFGTPTTVLGFSGVNVQDDNGMSWGLITNSDSFTYSRWVGDGLGPGVHVFDNTATILETGDSDDASIRVTVIPAPATLALLGIGIAGLAATRRRRS